MSVRILSNGQARGIEFKETILTSRFGPPSYLEQRWTRRPQEFEQKEKTTNELFI